jgi:hypothetical protein
MATYEETSSRATEMAIRKLKRAAGDGAGCAEIVEDEKRKARAGETRKAENNGDDAIEQAPLKGRAGPQEGGR